MKLKYAFMSVIALFLAQASAAHGFNLTGDSLLYSQSTFDSSVSCGILYAPSNNDDNQAVFISSPVTMTAGQTVLMQGQLLTQSNYPSTAIVNVMHLIVVPSGQPVDLSHAINEVVIDWPSTGSTYPVLVSTGENNVGYNAAFEPYMTLQQEGLFTAPTAGNYVFALVSYASTSASGSSGSPTCSSHSGFSYWLSIGSGASSSFMKIWSVQGGLESIQVHSWQDGYDTLNSSSPSGSILKNTYTVGATTTSVKVGSEFQMSTIHGYNSTATANVALGVENLTSGTTLCYPGGIPALIVGGQPECLPVTQQSVIIAMNATYSKHHQMVYLEGTVPASLGDQVHVWTEIGYVDGSNGVIINTGCDQAYYGSACPASPDGGTTPEANLVIWP